MTEPTGIDEPTSADQPSTDQPRGASIEPTDAEDRKILTLARAARARTDAAQGASVRDTDGRTYAASSVALASLRLSAVQVAVAMAVSSGAPGLEAVAVVGAERLAEADRAVIADLGGKSIVVWLADPAGAVEERVVLP
ncbi:MAG: cytidine deaminase [Microlunatus sp.]|nr:cytidine deaminase [Microlunatus sp.]